MGARRRVLPPLAGGGPGTPEQRAPGGLRPGVPRLLGAEPAPVGGRLAGPGGRDGRRAARPCSRAQRRQYPRRRAVPTAGGPARPDPGTATTRLPAHRLLLRLYLRGTPTAVGPTARDRSGARRDRGAD